MMGFGHPAVASAAPGPGLPLVTACWPAILPSLRGSGGLRVHGLGSSVNKNGGSPSLERRLSPALSRFASLTAVQTGLSERGYCGRAAGGLPRAGHGGPPAAAKEHGKEGSAGLGLTCVRCSLTAPRADLAAPPA